MICLPGRLAMLECRFIKQRTTQGRQLGETIKRWELQAAAGMSRDMKRTATSTVRVINFSSQNCIQADIHSPSPLPHMNLNVSERLIWTKGFCHGLRTVTGLKKQNS